MKKPLNTLNIIIVVLVGISVYFGVKMTDYKNTLIASTSYCEEDSDCTTIVLDRDGCLAMPMSTGDKRYFEITYTDFGGCDALVTERPVATCKENSCVFTKK